MHRMNDLILLTTPQIPCGSFRYPDPMSFSAHRGSCSHDTDDLGHGNANGNGGHPDLNGSLDW